MSTIRRHFDPFAIPIYSEVYLGYQGYSSLVTPPHISSVRLCLPSINNEMVWIWSITCNLLPAIRSPVLVAGRGVLTDTHPACTGSPGLLNMSNPWEQRDTELYMKCLSSVNAGLGSQVRGKPADLTSPSWACARQACITWGFSMSYSPLYITGCLQLFTLRAGAAARAV